MSGELTQREKWMYGVGDIGFSLTTTILGAYFAIFLTDVVGLRPGIAAVAVFIGKSWDYINDPLFGHISDRTRTRWGRRRPYLLFGALPLALTFTMLWWRPSLENPIALAGYYSLAYLLYEAAATILYMPYFALTPELTSDYDERTSLTSYRMFFSILGSLLSFTLPLMIVGSFAPENAGRVFLMGLFFGFLAAAPMLVVFFGTEERDVYIELDKPTLWQSLKAAWDNRPFRYSLAIFLATWISVDVLQSMLLFFIKYVVRRESQNDVIMATIFVVAIFALPIWNWVSKRWSKRWAYIYGIAFWAVVQMVLITVNPQTSLWVILFLCTLAGVGVAAAHVLPWAILPDAIEWDEYQTGKRHEGMFYSLTTLTRKIASSVAIPLVLLLLEFTGYQPNVSQQPSQALLGIRLVIGPLPALLLAVGIFFAYKYPLDREHFTQIVKELKLRRAKQE
ncbi:MAG: glycoside-pentoside-hexuronide (GPH):cation symporter [Anaerolineales bacterium]|nr:glycoside-pentoside-hexuronide (GPH):cation symporter [Anaerolineales bacterium]MBS3752676.1 glycoside-pentoside-hexuronide (GPH):cation symporter [Anaerolineales bacterium]